jgi:hypothetical protein
MTGEIQLAAWDWGAGRYPDWRAILFCSPLIVCGSIVPTSANLAWLCRGAEVREPISPNKCLVDRIWPITADPLLGNPSEVTDVSCRIRVLSEPCGLGLL